MAGDAVAEVKSRLDLIEVIGSLRPGDMVVRRATDEVREGAPIR